jgi:hypothetical protein
MKGVSQLPQLNSLQPVSKVGVVIPTLGDRPSSVGKTLASALAAGVTRILIVTTQEAYEAVLETPGVKPSDVRVQSPNQKGAAQAINIGLAEFLQDESLFASAWIGDDDQLNPEGFKAAAAMLWEHVGASSVVGKCQVVDETDRTILTISPRKLDVDLLEVKSNKLPQPGSIFANSALRKVGLLDSRLRFAFDQDLFLYRAMQSHVRKE